MQASTTMSVNRADAFDLHAHQYPKDKDSAAFVCVTIDWSHDIQTKAFFSTIDDVARLANRLSEVVVQLRKEQYAVALPNVE